MMEDTAQFSIPWGGPQTSIYPRPSHLGPPGHRSKVDTR